MSLTCSISERFDQVRAEAFLERICQILNDGAIAVMLSIGHRTGLFDLMAKLPPRTSAEIAAAAELSERYVREWLAAMVVGGIVVYDAARRTYALPAEHAASLARDASLANMAVFGQHVAMMGKLEDKILACFETGAGTCYDDYPRFHEVMAEDSAQTVVAQLFDAVLPLSGELSRRLADGVDVLDAGCGRGAALIAMAKRYPKSRFTGYDLDGDAIAYADRVSHAEGLGNVRFQQRDLSAFDERDRYDVIATFDAVHDQRDPQRFLRSIHGALRRGGIYLMQDIGGSTRLENNVEFPMAALLYAVSLVHCTPISLGQGGAGLGTMWGWETAEAMLKTAGFLSVERHVLPHDPMNVWFVTRKG